MSFHLNERAARLTETLTADSAALGVTVSAVGGARIVDAGIASAGGLAAGIALARICLSDFGAVQLIPGSSGPTVQVATDHPVAACLASQYAGWQVQVGKWFGMGSGPMRAAYGREPLFQTIAGREEPPVVVGVFEARKLPNEDVIAYLAEKLSRPAGRLTLWAAPTSSLAGMVQIVARSVETALHKLHELKFDLTTLRHGFGSAPLPPLCPDDLTALGRTNDAILYGGRVHLWLDADDDVLADLGPRVPASASPAFGTPFGELFQQAGHDFYKLDPHLFAPAEVVFHNRRSGRTFSFGRRDDDVLRRSFGL
jgi:methenyltetrahydromethanopterin cyclohydrolase